MMMTRSVMNGQTKQPKSHELDFNDKLKQIRMKPSRLKARTSQEVILSWL